MSKDQIQPPKNFHQKALHLSRSMKKKARREKQEIAHVLCEYLAMVLAQGHKKTKLR
jgi:hypothetical protein